jgi:hypothetical protein
MSKIVVSKKIAGPPSPANITGMADCNQQTCRRLDLMSRSVGVHRRIALAESDQVKLVNARIYISLRELRRYRPADDENVKGVKTIIFASRVPA